MTSFENLDELKSAIFSGENNLKGSPARCFLSTTFNAASKLVNKPSMDQGVFQNKSTSRLWTACMENTDSWLNFAKKRPALGALVEVVGAKFNLDTAEDKERYVPTTGAW